MLPVDAVRFQAAGPQSASPACGAEASDGQHVFLPSCHVMGWVAQVLAGSGIERQIHYVNVTLIFSLTLTLTKSIIFVMHCVCTGNWTETEQ